MFTDFLNNTCNLFIYGAGTVAKKVIEFCEYNHIIINGIIVTDDQSITSLNNIPVYQIHDLQKSDFAFAECDLLVAVLLKSHKERAAWNDFLFEFPFARRYTISVEDNRRLDQWRVMRKLEKASEYLTEYCIDLESANCEQNHKMIVDSQMDIPLCRCEIEELISDISPFEMWCKRSYFERNYGDVLLINHNSYKGIFDSYVVLCHLDKVNVSDMQEEGYIPIQVGAALTDIRKGCLTDDTGDNISPKNRDYSECTALYWIWKNTSGQQYIGLNHYRRRLILDESSITDIKEKNIDVVLSIPHFCVDTVRDFFMRFVSKHDWAFMKEKIIAYNSEYEVLWEQYENGHFYFHGNLALWKREWFDRYCEFAFHICEAIEDEYNKRNIIRQDRYMGFLFENLTSFFVMVHKDELKIACTEMKWIG